MNLISLFRNSEAKPFAAGQTVFAAGAAGDAMYIVLEGDIAIRAGETDLEVLGPGSIFGEMALIDGAPRSASAVAASDCRLVEIDRRRFEFMVSQTPYFALAVMKTMADRLRKSNARMQVPALEGGL
ncbi:MAG TPA: Crp/Fnr family transcriptional regulator [Bryobacteraceae bacterium]|jgi:CRP-like cAMP-binding protein|nr:Crp/Fnr family transcriptional regulator [Bryobacteraceae bacterium]